MTRPSATSGSTGDPLEGQVIDDRYTIKSLIGRGGMGLVYLASDGHSGRDVVVKMLSSHWVDDAHAVARFDREGKRLSELSHLNIVTMYGFGRHLDRAYIVMEYLEGEHLRHYLARKGTLRLADFVPIASQIVAGVGWAHARGIMLRDIKPANIMLCERDGKANFVKILDFGLAKMVEGDDVEVTKSHLVGTAGYLAPEQIKGEPSDVRVDVYALGILFFQMLAGQSPIHGDNDGAILYNHVHGEPKRLQDVLPAGHDIPKGLIDLIHRCIEKDPDRRPGDANEIADILFECVPSRLFALPAASADSRAGIESFKAHTLRRATGDLDEESEEATNRWNKAALAREARSPGGTTLGADAKRSGAPRPGRAPSSTGPRRAPAPTPARPKPPPRSPSRQLEVIEGGAEEAERKAPPKKPPRRPMPASRVAPPTEHETGLSAEPLRGLADVLEPAPAKGASAAAPGEPAISGPASTDLQVPTTVELDAGLGEAPARGLARGGVWAAVAGIVVLLGGGGAFLAMGGAGQQPAASGVDPAAAPQPGAEDAPTPSPDPQDAPSAAAEPHAQAGPDGDEVELVVEASADQAERDEAAAEPPAYGRATSRPRTKGSRSATEPVATGPADATPPAPAEAPPKPPPEPQGSKTPSPVGDGPKPSSGPSKAPPPPPPSESKPKKDDVFIEPGKKDDGIFLPVGKK